MAFDAMVRFRIVYKKMGAIRFASHRDLMRVFRRGFTAGRVPVCYSQGFNPHPKLSFGPSLRTGWEGLGECMDLMLEHPVDDLPARCNDLLPGGLDIVESVQVSTAAPKLSVDVAAARYKVIIDPTNLDQKSNPKWKAFLEGTDLPVAAALEADARHRFASVPDGDPRLLSIHVIHKDGSLCLEYLSTMRQGKSIFPEEILEPNLGAIAEMDVPPVVVRKELLVQRGDDLLAVTDPAVVRATI
jgi:radical SAM-linked protein